MDIEILHAPENDEGEFYIENQNGERSGSLFYTLKGSNRLVIQHTEVGEELKGTGASVKLLNRVADFARKSGKRIVPVCPFAKAYMTKHRDQFSDVLV